MRAGARGFVLFSFAFSYVLTAPENVIPLSSLKVENVPESKSNEPKIMEKVIYQIEGTTTPETGHDLDKRAAMFAPENPYGNRLNTGNSNFILDNNDLEKRSRMGFTGMRGKKECPDEDTENCGQIETSNDDSSMDENKRSLRGFGAWFGGKRAPLSFHGMRGKKSEENGNEITGTELLNYKAALPTEEFLINSGLLDDRDKTGFDLTDLRGEKPEDESPEEEGESFNKRSPYSFQGMRGKKNNFYNLKRAMGFLGMRGKKGTQFWYPDGYYKRVPQSSFFGMKGKKAQFNGFFGMRGKKASTPPFLDLQDKQEPPIYDLEDITLLDGTKASESSRNRFRRGTVWLSNSKKAKNAFFGIRGKKLVEESPQNRFSAIFE